MPLFIFLSGMFYKDYESFFLFLKKKVKALLIPFFFWYLIGSVAVSLFLYNTWDISLQNMGTFNIRTALPELFINEDCANGPVWFLLALFEINILYFLIRLLPNTIGLVLTIVLSAIGYYLGRVSLNIPCFIDSCFTFMIFFTGGHHLFKMGFLVKDVNKICVAGWLILSVAIIWRFGFYVNYRTNYFPGSTVFSAFPCAVLGIFSILFICKFLEKSIFLQYIGRNTLIILVTHRLIYQCWNYPITTYTHNIHICLTINFILTLLSYCILIPVFNKYFPVIIGK